MNEKAIYSAVGAILREMGARFETRIAAIESRPSPEPGAPGAPGVGIKSIIADGDDAARVIFTNGESARVTLPRGPRGEPGPEGNGIKAVAECDDGVIEFEFDNGATARVTLPRGERGERGEKGEPGVDRVTVAPRFIDADERIAKNEIVYHGGGLHQAIREAHGDPSRDPGSYRCIVAGIASIDVADNWAARTVEITARMSNGQSHTVTRPMGPRFLPEGERAGVKTVAGDFYFDGEWFVVVQRDNPTEDADRLRVNMRGPRGRRGLPGEPGAPGRDPVDLADVTLDGEVLTFVLSNGVEKSLLLPVPKSEQPQGAIRRFAGWFDSPAAYSAGEVVRSESGLFLALADVGAGEPLTDPEKWAQMAARSLGGGGGGGGGGISPADLAALRDWITEIDAEIGPKGTIVQHGNIVQWLGTLESRLRSVENIVDPPPIPVEVTNSFHDSGLNADYTTFLLGAKALADGVNYFDGNQHRLKPVWKAGENGNAYDAATNPGGIKQGTRQDVWVQAAQPNLTHHGLMTNASSGNPVKVSALTTWINQGAYIVAHYEPGGATLIVDSVEHPAPPQPAPAPPTPKEILLASLKAAKVTPESIAVGTFYAYAKGEPALAQAAEDTITQIAAAQGFTFEQALQILGGIA
jgi:hypothetical protein